jgi:hypothetical protein
LVSFLNLAAFFSPYVVVSDDARRRLRGKFPILAGEMFVGPSTWEIRLFLAVLGIDNAE